jgi:hypothetical protein
MPLIVRRHGLCGGWWPDLKLGVMQPYFFPHLGYFALIAKTDGWVVFDTSQYTPKSWMNRNRVLHPHTGWMYVTVPLAHASQNMRTRDARVLDGHVAHRVVLGKLSHYRRHAPHYRAVIALVDRTFAGLRSESLVELNVLGMEAVCSYLGLPFKYHILSRMEISLGEVDHPGGWAVAIASAVGADVYLNPPGGRELFDPEEFRRRSVRLGFVEPGMLLYDPKPYTFEPQLSMLDVLMWNTPEAVRSALESSPVDMVT